MKFVRKVFITGLLILIGFTLLFFLLGGNGIKQESGLINFRSPLLFAHRGVVGEFPENTIESVRKARELGFRAVELDVIMTKDGELILFHDLNAGRLLQVDSLVSEMTFAQTQTHNLFWNNQKTIYKVCTLRQILQQFGNDFIFYFDLKESKTELADKLVALIKEFHCENRSIIADSYILLLAYIEIKNEGIVTSLEGFGSGKELIYSLIPKKLKPDFYSGFYYQLDNNHIKWLERNKLANRRILYGVDKTNYNTLQNYPIKNFIIDYDSALFQSIPE